MRKPRPTRRRGFRIAGTDVPRELAIQSKISPRLKIDLAFGAALVLLGVIAVFAFLNLKRPGAASSSRAEPPFWSRTAPVEIR